MKLGALLHRTGPFAHTPQLEVAEPGPSAELTGPKAQHLPLASTALQTPADSHLILQGPLLKPGHDHGTGAHWAKGDH